MSSPSLSVVLVTLDSYERLRKTMSHLARQTARQSIEMILVSQTRPPDVREADFAGFAGVRFVETGTFHDTGGPRAAGARAASAPLVAFAEDHCFPEPDWAAGLIQAYEGPWAAVCPAMSNANPGPVSSADFLLNFGHSAWQLPEGASQSAPWHNTSYRRDILLGYGDQLGRLLEAEIRIHEDLRRRGLQLFMAGSLRIYHVNLSRWPSFLACQLFGGRLYGAARAESGGWNLGRKLFYTAMLPLIPLRRLSDVLRNAKRTGVEFTPAFLLALAAGLSASALGEVSGYMLGQGNMGRRRVSFELERFRYVRPEDLEYLQPEPEVSMVAQG
jgi:hypothetical protein